MDHKPNVIVDHPTSDCIKHLVPVRDALYVIGGKWKLQIIISLRAGNKRFNQLLRTVEGISAKVLSNELKELELNKFVKKSLYSEDPVVVEYEITEYSDTLKDVLIALGTWGRMHRQTIVKDR